MRTTSPFLRLLLPALLVVAPAFASDTYKIDSVHSEVGFKIRHLVAKTSGRFTAFRGTITVDSKDLSKSSVEVTIDVASINTDNANRDADLRSEKFFDAAKYPTITFKSTAVKETSKGKLEITGDFTLHGVTKRISFPITSLGTIPGMRPGSTVIGFGDGALKLNRHDYGVSIMKGVLGDDVDISLDVEAVKQAPEALAAPKK
ncbi:MAG: polyisoprenoid-binding protein [Acidobacteriota bacterium]|nr:polyisoprenoid-binding protein [Acidobacteriota bacterium]